MKRWTSPRTGFGLIGCLAIIGAIVLALIIAAAVAGYIGYQRYFVPFMTVQEQIVPVWEAEINDIDAGNIEQASERLTESAGQEWNVEALTGLAEELKSSVGPLEATIVNFDELAPLVFESQWSESDPLPLEFLTNFEKGCVAFRTEFVKRGDVWKISALAYEIYPNERFAMPTSPDAYEAPGIGIERLPIKPTEEAPSDPAETASEGEPEEPAALPATEDTPKKEEPPSAPSDSSESTDSP